MHDTSFRSFPRGGSQLSSIPTDVHTEDPGFSCQECQDIQWEICPPNSTELGEAPLSLWRLIAITPQQLTEYFNYSTLCNTSKCSSSGLTHTNIVIKRWVTYNLRIFFQSHQDPKKKKKTPQKTISKITAGLGPPSHQKVSSTRERLNLQIPAVKTPVNVLERLVKKIIIIIKKGVAPSGEKKSLASIDMCTSPI